MIYRSLALAGLCAALFIGSPAFAQTVRCTDADIVRLTADINKVTDATKKAAAMKEIDMARQMMAQKNETACITHMETAMSGSK